MTDQEWKQLQVDIEDALLKKRDNEARLWFDRILVLENKPVPPIPVDYSLTIKDLQTRLVALEKARQEQIRVNTILLKAIEVKRVEASTNPFLKLFKK